MTDERLEVKVINLYKYNSFEELYKNFNKILLGYNENSKVSPSDMLQYYPIEEQNKYGVLAIEIEKL